MADDLIADPKRGSALTELAGNHRRITKLMVEMSDTLAKLAAAVDQWLPGDPAEFEARVRAQVAAEIAEEIEQNMAAHAWDCAAIARQHAAPSEEEQ